MRTVADAWTLVSVSKNILVLSSTSQFEWVKPADQRSYSINRTTLVLQEKTFFATILPHPVQIRLKP